MKLEFLVEKKILETKHVIYQRRNPVVFFSPLITKAKRLIQDNFRKHH